MRDMKVFVPLFFLGVHFASAGPHSLKYFYTATSEVPNFPEFVAVGMVDGVQMFYYDSNNPQAIPKQDWMSKIDDPQYWERNTANCMGSQQVFKVDIETIKQRFNQSGGVHTLQTMYGCEWDDETEAVTGGFYQFGYDGEDFISLDLKGKRWIAPVPQATITKNKWDSDKAQLEYLKNYFTKECGDWIKKYVQYGRSTLQKKVSPEVSLWQKDSSSPVECHATGFYPRQVMVSWQKNGQDLSEDVDLRETTLNGDGTFQKSSVLSLKPEDWKNKPEVYTCVVQHGGKDITVRLNVENVKRNPDPAGSNTTAIIIGIVVVAIVLIAVAVGVFMWNKSRSGYGKTSTSETDSENSDRPMQKA